MDMKLNSVVVAIGLVLLAASCHPAPVSQDSALLTQLLKKANTVLDRIIAQENGGSKKKEVDDVQLQQRNQDGSFPEFTSYRRALSGNDNTPDKRSLSDFLVMICEQLEAHGLHDAGCDQLDVDHLPIGERSYSEDELETLRLARSRTVSVISAVCEVFRRYNLEAPECNVVSPDAASRVDKQLDAGDRSEKGISEPEPAPQAPLTDGADNDISLEKVLRYLQYLRKHEQTKRDRD